MAKSLPGHGVVCRASEALRRLRLYFLAARQSTGVAVVEEAYPVEAGGVYPNRHWTDDARDVVFGIIGSPGRLDYVPDGSPAPPAVPVAVQNQMRVGELIEALLQYDPGQEILTQAVMPDGSVFYAVLAGDLMSGCRFAFRMRTVVVDALRRCRGVNHCGW